MLRPVTELDLESRRVLVRVDFDCPVEDGKVTDNVRIRSALPTIRHALNRRAKLVLMSHRGDPGGRPDETLGLEPVGMELAGLLDTDVILADDCIGDGARKVVSDLYGGRVAMLENLDFHPGETGNDERFARVLSEMGDVYVNEAFALSHERRASLDALARLFAERGAGLLTATEVEMLGLVRGETRRPFVVVIGGRVLAGKVRFLHGLLDRADTLLVGGGAASTLLAARGLDLGASPVEHGSLVHARGILEEARRRSVRVHLPLDLVVTTAEGDDRVVPATEVPGGSSVSDVGPATVAAWESHLEAAGTVLWSGTLGRWETPPHDAGTRAVAEVLGRCAARTVAFGEDTARALRALRIDAMVEHLSTGDGASLAFVEGRDLPGLAALEV